MSTPKTIVLTGGNRGLGRATAEKLARAGHRVVLTARDPAQGSRAADEIRAAVPGASVASGKFFAEKKELASSPESHDAEKAGRFWRLACTCTGEPDWP